MPEEKLKIVREFFIQLRKGVKTIGMYKHSPNRFPEFLRAAFTALTAALEGGPLQFKITDAAFVFGGEPVWTADGDNIPFRFYREGVRHLVMRPGVEEAELTRLVLIMLTPTERGGEEIVSQLWNATFSHVEYVVVEGFSVGSLSEEQVEVEVDQIVDYLYARLRGASDDSLSFARVSAADLELKLEGIEQIRGAIFDGDAISATFRARIQEQLKADQGVRLYQKTTDLTLGLGRAGRITDAVALAEIYAQILDATLLAGEVTPILELLGKLKAAEAEPRLSALCLAVRPLLAKKLGEDHRLRALADSVKGNRQIDPSMLARYFAELDAHSVGPLLDLLDALEQPEHRAVLIDALATLGKDTPDFFASRLGSDKSQTVRDMIAIIDKAQFPERAKYFGAALKNPNVAVRLEVLAILGRSKSVETSHRFVLEATTDSSPQMRAAAFRALVQLSPIRASTDLLRLPNLPTWEKRELVEKELIYRCLGQTQTPQALQHCITLLQQKKTLLGGKKVIENKLLAVIALGEMTTLQSFKILQSAVESQDPEVISSARKALYGVKKALSEAMVKPASSDALAQQRAEGAATAAIADSLFKGFEEAKAASAEEKAMIQKRVADQRLREEAEERRSAEERDANKAAHAAHAVKEEADEASAAQILEALDEIDVEPEGEG